MKAGGAYYAEVVTSNQTTGAAANADSTPVATANKNGTDDSAFVLTVTNVDAGRYKITGTIPAGYVAGDVVSISVAATVSSVATKQVVDKLVILDSISLDLAQTIPASNSAGSLGDSMNAARAQGFGKWVLVGSTLTLYGSDGTTPVRIFTLDNPSHPTQRI